MAPSRRANRPVTVPGACEEDATVSRYVRMELSAVSLAEVEASLTRLGIAYARGPVLLRGSVECVGDPVDLRLDARPHGAVEDFGFAQRGTTLELVCGELDRDHLSRTLLTRVVHDIRTHAVRNVAERLGLAVEADGTRIRIGYDKKRT